MFNNIGKKIKSLAIFVFVLGVIGSIVGAIVDLAVMMTGIGIVLLPVGIVLSWISVFFIYGFGELIERVTSIDNKLGAVHTVPTQMSTASSSTASVALDGNTSVAPVAPPFVVQQSPTAPSVQSPSSSMVKTSAYGDAVPVGIGKCAHCKWSDELWECVVQEGEHSTRKRLCEECLGKYKRVTNGYYQKAAKQ